MNSYPLVLLKQGLLISLLYTYSIYFVWVVGICHRLCTAHNFWSSPLWPRNPQWFPSTIFDPPTTKSQWTKSLQETITWGLSHLTFYWLNKVILIKAYIIYSKPRNPHSMRVISWYHIPGFFRKQLGPASKSQGDWFLFSAQINQVESTTQQFQRRFFGAGQAWN